MTNDQALAILNNLKQYKHTQYSNVNQAMLNRAITDDNARQNALTEYEAVCTHLKANGYKVVDTNTNETIYLNQERFETVPVLDVHGVITDGTKNVLITFNQYGTLLNEIKELQSIRTACENAGAEMTKLYSEQLFALLKRKASIDANTRYSIRWETQAESLLRESKRKSYGAVTI